MGNIIYDPLCYNTRRKIYIYFLYNRYKFIGNNKNDGGILLTTIYGSLDPFEYHVENCVIDAFKKLENELLHTSCPRHRDGDGEVENDLDVEDEVEENEDLIETNYTNGSNEVAKIFHQKSVICLERDSVYAFRQCVYQCVCEQWYQSKGDIDMLKCVACRT